MRYTVDRAFRRGVFFWIATWLLTLSTCSWGGEQKLESDWETIRPDYSNVRGLNYIASYAPSDVAMWRFYDSDQIDRELAMIKDLGANSIRVWLAWVVYDVEGETFVQKFEDFLSLCEKHRLTVMPILWDSCFGDERAEYDDVQDWVANPGTKRVADPDFRLLGDKYVQAVVKAGSQRRSLLVWDIMNEPSGPGVNDWLNHYCQLVKKTDPNHPITIGWAHASSNDISGKWVDVMSYHPYGIFDKNRQIWTESVRGIARRYGNKPILATEAGGPGLGQRYEECLASFERQQVGFYLFEAMVGTNRFRNITGFFYPDGSPREVAPIESFQALARRQGSTATGAFPAPSRQPPYQIAGIREVTNLILHWDQDELTPENYARREPLLTWTFISLAWGGALKDHLEQVQGLKQQVDAAVADGDMETVREATSQLAKIAAELLIRHGFIEAPEEP
jgi:hypothetical protein